MALTPDEQKKLNQLIQEGIKLAKQLNDTQQASSFQNFTGSLSDAERIVKSLRQDWSDYVSDIGGAREGFARIVDEMKNMNSGLGQGKKAFSDLSSLAAKLQSHQQGISTLSVKELQNLKKKVAEKVNDLELSKKLIAEEIAALELKKRNNSLGDAEQARLTKLENAHGEINNELSEQSVHINRFNTQLDEQIKLEEQINAKLGLTGKLIKGISRVPLVGQFVDADKALGKMRDTAQAGGSKIAVLGAGFKSIGGDIAKGIMDPLFLVTQLVKMFINVDKQAGEFAKSQNISYKDSLKMREEYAAMAASSGDMSLNARAFMETQSAIGAQLGTNAKINKADLETFTKLREKAGFTNEELMGVQQLSLVNGKSLKKNTSEILGGAKAYASRNKLVVNEKQILKDISKASASLKLSLGGSANELARSAVQARKFGLNLEQAEKMSQSLLDFESSIENELSAELLTGKDLNLERARGLALNGDSAAAAAEIASQVGSAANFGKMNVIQQEAIAKSVGMQRDELAQSLIDKESLAKLSAKEGQTALEAYQAMKDKGRTEAQIAEELGNKELAKQYEQQSNAEKFAQTMEHVKEIFVSIVDGPMGDILNGLASMLKNTKVIYAITGLLAGMYAGKLIQGIMQAIAQVGVMIAANTANAAAATTAATAMSLGAMIPVILGGVGAIMGLVASFTADDMMSAPPGYGKRTLLGPEGAIHLNDKDTVIAGVDLFGNDVSSEPGKPTKMGGKGEIKVKSEGGDMSAVISAINSLANRPINVSVQLDGKELAVVQGKYPNEAGDANRKNSYKIS
jgi:uncharacterized membrane protein